MLHFNDRAVAITVEGGEVKRMPLYPVAEDGEWVYPRRKGYMLECCDCSLIHRLNFRLVKTANGGKAIQFQAFRDNRATGRNRRRQGIMITRKKT